MQSSAGNTSNSRDGWCWYGKLSSILGQYSVLQSFIVISGGVLSFLPVMSSLKYIPAISTPDEIIVSGSATAALALISPLLVDWAMDMMTSITSRVSIEVDDDVQLFHFLSPSEMIIALFGLAIAPCVDLGMIREHNSTASACARASRLVLVIGVIMKSLYRMNSKVWSGRVVTALIMSLLIFAVTSVYSDAYQLIGDRRAGPLTAVKGAFGLFFVALFFTLMFLLMARIVLLNISEPNSAQEAAPTEGRSVRQSINNRLLRHLSGLSKVNSEKSIPAPGDDAKNSGKNSGRTSGRNSGRNTGKLGNENSFRKLSDDKLTISRVVNVEKEAYEFVYTLIVAVVFTLIFVAYVAAGNVYTEKAWGRILIDVSFLIFALALNVINVRRAKTRLINCLIALTRAKNTIIRYLSHELRNPMNSASLGLKLIIQGIEEVGDRRFYDLLETARDAKQSIGCAVQVLDGLKNIVQIENGLLQLHPRDVHIIPFLEGCVRPYTEQAERLGIDLLFDVQATGSTTGSRTGSVKSSSVKLFQAKLVEYSLELDDMARFDRLKISQVFNTVVANALKFSPRNGTGEVVINAVFVTPEAQKRRLGIRQQREVSLVSMAPAPAPAPAPAVAPSRALPIGSSLEVEAAISAGVSARIRDAEGAALRPATRTGAAAAAGVGAIGAVGRGPSSRLGLGADSQVNAAGDQASNSSSRSRMPAFLERLSSTLSNNIRAIRRVMPLSAFNRSSEGHASSSQHRSQSDSQRRASTNLAPPKETRGVLRITVTDNGVGISPENQKRLFSDTLQFNPEVLRTGGGAGSGLSLLVAKGIMDLHGGTISVFSEGEGKGAIFTIELPMRKVIGRSTPAGGSRRGSDQRERGPPRRSQLQSSPSVSHVRNEAAASAYNGYNANTNEEPSGDKEVDTRFVSTNIIGGIRPRSSVLRQAPLQARSAVNAPNESVASSVPGYNSDAKADRDFSANFRSVRSGNRRGDPSLRAVDDSGILSRNSVFDFATCEGSLKSEKRRLQGGPSGNPNDIESTSRFLGTSGPAPGDQAGEVSQAGAESPMHVRVRRRQSPQSNLFGGDRSRGDSGKQDSSPRRLRPSIPGPGPRPGPRPRLDAGGGAGADADVDMGDDGEMWLQVTRQTQGQTQEQSRREGQRRGRAIDHKGMEMTTSTGAFGQLQGQDPGQSQGQGQDDSVLVVRRQQRNSVNAQRSAPPSRMTSTRTRQKALPSKKQSSDSSSVSQGVRYTGPKFFVLIVDDSELARKMLRKTLVAAGHTCEEAENGLVGVEMVQKRMLAGLAEGSATELREAAAPGKNAEAEAQAGAETEGEGEAGAEAASKKMYDCVLMDFTMPVMDGPTATQEIRALGYKQPIYGVTGNTVPSDFAKFVAFGATKVFPKPFRLKLFHEEMAQFAAPSTT